VPMVQMVPTGAEGRRSQRVQCNAGQAGGPCCFLMRAVCRSARTHLDMGVGVETDMDMDRQRHPSDNAAGRRRTAKWGLDRTANRTRRRRRQWVQTNGPGEADATRGRARLSESGSAGGDEARLAEGSRGVESQDCRSSRGELELELDWHWRSLALTGTWYPTPAAWRQ
jgi:hypothetical protein